MLTVVWVWAILRRYFGRREPFIHYTEAHGTGVGWLPVKFGIAPVVGEIATSRMDLSAL